MIQVNARGMLAITPTITAITPKNKAGLKTTAVQNYQFFSLCFLLAKAKWMIQNKLQCSLVKAEAHLYK